MAPTRHITISIVSILMLILTSKDHTVMARFATSKTIVQSVRGGQQQEPTIHKPNPSRWLAVCNQLAPATSVLCSLAPLPTIIQASRSKSVGSLPLLPYSSMAANGFIWALYGYLTDSPQGKHIHMVYTIMHLFSSICIKSFLYTLI